MNKTLLMVMTSLMLSVTALASPAGKTMGDLLDVPIHTRDGQVDQIRPRSVPLFVAHLETELNELFVFPHHDVGFVDVVIENLFNGEYAEFSFDSSMAAFFPISGNAGFWRISLTLDSGDVYYGEFFL